jgi:hypothetical protein
MECNSLQWFYILPSKPYAKQCHSGKFAFAPDSTGHKSLFIFFIIIIIFWGEGGSICMNPYIQTLQMAVVMGDRSNQSDVRADRKV